MSAANDRSPTGPSSWALAVSIRGAPTSEIVSSRSSSTCCCIASRSCRTHRTRSSVLRDQSVESNARRAASMARPMSSASASAATPSTSSVAGLTVGKVPARPSDSLPSMSSALIPSPHRAIYRSQLLRLSSSIGHLSDIASSRPYPQGRYTVLTDAPGATSRRGQSHVSCMFSRLACLLPRPSDSLDMCPAMYWLPPRPSAKPNPTPKRCHATAASRQPSARC
ncbi:Uncharacterised protein [Mycobacterium tuberculosis]|nr:Uncharacterised protein [Mycobacterium tuberculosis]CKQ82387.1 Uncharacterised protein [Mycobacterium tuberculosis]CKR04401.1 Uncharacterised protein [Mycobacterium tuberculosis]CKT38007.1 Uncharacterised protein [Mycobacterium tuberculosis]CKU32330.1 Uncharacterised protein [Mycobacterium tuberculosis]